MRKKIALLLSIAMVLSLAPVVASADKASYISEVGVYDINEGSDVTITVLDAEDAEINSQTVDGTSVKFSGIDGSYTFYAAPEKLKVSIKNTDNSKQYLVMLVTGAELPNSATEILYIDQAAGNSEGDLEFIVYPEFPSANQDLTIWITSNDSEFSAADHKSTLSYYGSPYVLGDVDGNGEIDSADAVCVLQHTVNAITLEGVQAYAADVNCDGAIDSSDAVYILQYTVNAISSFDEIKVNK